MPTKTTYQVWWCTHNGGSVLGQDINRTTLLFEANAIHEAIEWITRYIAFPGLIPNHHTFSGNDYAAIIYEAVDNVIKGKHLYARARSSVWPPQLPVKKQPR